MRGSWRRTTRNTLLARGEPAAPDVEARGRTGEEL
jgi:hypothetical protein